MEMIQIQVGAFASRHLRFTDGGSARFGSTHPPYDVRITDHEDGVFLKGGVGGYIQTWYELVSLER